MQHNLANVSDVYPREISNALKTMGDYVYAYYRPGEFQPFYVGKGKKIRVLDHWKNAVRSSPKKDQEKEIRCILQSGDVPTIKLLAYNLQKTKSDQVYSVAERVLEDAFGIQSVWDKRSGTDRIVLHESFLLQKREDSRNTPVLSLDAVVARAGVCKQMDIESLVKIIGAPVLLVGISKTYHASYSEEQLAEMARMYWPLENRKGEKLCALKENPSSVLLAWVSQPNGIPTIVGAWRIKHNTIKKRKGSHKYQLSVVSDINLRKMCIGIRLAGKGNKYEGQRIIIPE